MALKIQPASATELEEDFGTSTSGNDPETVQFIRGLPIGGGFTVTADAEETDRMVKRRINACAKEAFRELDWRVKADGKTLAARVKAIDTKAQDEAEAKAKAEAEAKVKAEAEAKAAEKAPPPAQPAQNGAQEPVGAGKGSK